MSAAARGTRLVIAFLLACSWAKAVPAQPKQTATEFYMQYRSAMEKAKAIEDVFPMMSKDVRAKIEATPADRRQTMFEFVKEMSTSMKVKVVKETKTADGVMLTVEGVSATDKSTGQIQIVQEDGTWKMGKESWSSKG